MMNRQNVSEWRGWIALTVFLAVSMIGAMYSLFAKAEHYTDLRVRDVREQVDANMTEIREDLRVIREDIKALLRSR